MTAHTMGGKPHCEYKEEAETEKQAQGGTSNDPDTVESSNMNW